MGLARQVDEAQTSEGPFSAEPIHCIARLSSASSFALRMLTLAVCGILSLMTSPVAVDVNAACVPIYVFSNSNLEWICSNSNC